MEIPFLKNITRSSKLVFGRGKEESYVGIDIGLSSVKVVQLRKADEKAVLETYGQLKSDGYLKNPDPSAVFLGFLRYMDEDIASAIRDVFREAKVTTRNAIISVPAHASFIALAEMPKIPLAERASVLSLESRRYVPIPQSESFTNWVVIEDKEESDRMKVLFVAVPRDIISKYQRIAKSADIDLLAIEMESFGAVRSLASDNYAPTLILYLGFESTIAIIVDEGILRVSHTVDRGQEFLTNALARNLNLSKENAEDFKNNIGLSDKIEEQEIANGLETLLEVMFREVLRVTDAYNRENERKIEKIVLTGGGARTKGLVEYVARIFGTEVSIGNAFGRVTYPQFMQPILRDVSPHFAVSVGLALREMEK